MSEQTNNTVEDIVRYVENLRAKTKMCFLPDDLNYLHAGGRCSNLSLACGKVLGIRPLALMASGAVR
ncbi:MAG: DegV family protein [Hydrogeniiclostridium mannosilyticum]